ncbi:MAG TPA: carbon-nitrogen hydrolase family protein [Opitutaceae bacterium]
MKTIFPFLAALASFLSLLLTPAHAAPPVTPAPDAWKQWSPRAEIAPVFSLAPTAGREGRAALQIAARNVSDFGAWRTAIPNLSPGKTYRFTAWFRPERIENPRRSVIARLEWLDAAGKPVRFSVRPPEYPIDGAREGGWTRMESIVLAPEGIAALDVQLSLAFSTGAVTWSDVSLEEIAPPRERIVRAMTVHHRPRKSASREANVATYTKIIRDAAPAQRPDIVCLPEGMTVVGTGKSYVEVSEPVPGPTTAALGALARELRAYVVAGLYEREAPAVYNTAVLLDRDGKLVGKYRKTHLPREEWEAGLMPGDTYPIFHTDFGKLGILICWDVQFPEPWRALGLQGADLILLPIWGGSETLLRARAIENSAFVVSSGYDIKSCIVAPDGKILSEASNESPAVTVALHLDQKIYQPWLGDMRTRTWKERRGDLPW